MRTPNRNNIPKPAELSSNECIAHRDAIIGNPSTQASADFYRGRIEQADGTVTFSVRDALKTLYNNKCAYCEKFAHQPRVDHHRPKGRIVGMPRNSNGYFWLVYEWTNLLPSCTDCNSIEAKGSHYPVRGVRNLLPSSAGNPPAVDYNSFGYSDAFNTQELPELLHPEYCVVTTHFSFDTNGVIRGLTGEGRETVAKIKLDRADLNGWRRAIYEEKLNGLRGLMLSYFTEPEDNVKEFVKRQIFQWLITLVDESKNDDLEYTFFRKTLVSEFDNFFIETLELELRPIMRELFVECIASL